MSPHRWLAAAILSAAAIHAQPASAATVWRGPPIASLAADGPRVAIVTTPRGTTCTPVRLVDLRSGWAPLVAGQRSLSCRAIAAATREHPADIETLVLSGRRALWTVDTQNGSPVLDPLSDGSGSTTGLLLERAPRRRGRIVQIASAWVADPARSHLTARGGGDAVIVEEEAWAYECDEEGCATVDSHGASVLRRLSGRAPIEIPYDTRVVAAWPDRLLVDRGAGLELVNAALARQAVLAPQGPLELGDLARDGATIAVLTAARELVRFDVATGAETARQPIAVPGRLVAVHEGVAVLADARTLRAVRLSDGATRVIARVPAPGYVAVAESSLGVAYARNRARHGTVGLLRWPALTDWARG